jgi:hypothetical protein
MYRRVYVLYIVRMWLCACKVCLCVCVHRHDQSTLFILQRIRVFARNYHYCELKKYAYLRFSLNRELLCVDDDSEF